MINVASKGNDVLLMRNVGQSRRAAFTLLEILVVVAIIGVLVGLLLPSIQSSREMARLRSCENNLRQLWLATESYRFSNKVYPAGTIAETLPVQNFPADNHQGWLLRIAPELSGGMNQVSGFDYSRSVYDPVNWPVAATVSEVLSCPSSNRGWSPVGDNHSNYVGIYDGRDVPIDRDNRGALVANSFLSDADFKDGLQNTVLLGEIANPIANLGWTSGTVDTLRTLGLPPASAWMLGWQSNSQTFISSPYGWCIGDRKQSYTEFVDAAVSQLLTSGIYYEQQSVKGLTASEMTKAEKEAYLQLFESDVYIDLLENSVQAESDSMTSESDDSGVDEDNESSAIEGQSGHEDLFDEYFFGDDTDTDEIKLFYPVPLIGKQGYETAGLSSFHRSGVNVVFLDGRTSLLSWQIDQKILSTLGIRDDGQPLLFDR